MGNELLPEVRFSISSQPETGFIIIIIYYYYYYYYYYYL